MLALETTSVTPSHHSAQEEWAGLGRTAWLAEPSTGALSLGGEAPSSQVKGEASLGGQQWGGCLGLLGTDQSQDPAFASVSPRALACSQLSPAFHSCPGLSAF